MHALTHVKCCCYPYGVWLGFGWGLQSFSELSVALAQRGKETGLQVVQIYPEYGKRMWVDVG